MRTYLERDLQDIAGISSLPDFRRVMRAACLRVGQILNQSDLARDISISQPTAHRYLNLLETSYLLVRLPACAVNRTKRLVKSPKAYWSDTGLAMHLSQESEPRGGHLENIVLHDLLAWRDSRMKSGELFYWRTANGEEVDFVIESAGRLLPIEVKTGQRARLSDTKHLRTFIDEYRERSLPRAPVARRRLARVDRAVRARGALMDGDLIVGPERAGSLLVLACARSGGDMRRKGER